MLMSNSSKERRSWGITQLTDQCLLLFKTSLGKKTLVVLKVFKEPVQSAGQQMGCNTPLGPQTTTAVPWRLCRFFHPLSLGSYPGDQIQSLQHYSLLFLFPVFTYQTNGLTCGVTQGDTKIPSAITGAGARGSTTMLHQTLGPNCSPAWARRQWEV